MHRYVGSKDFRLHAYLKPNTQYLGAYTAENYSDEYRDRADLPYHLTSALSCTANVFAMLRGRGVWVFISIISHSEVFGKAEHATL